MQAFNTKNFAGCGLVEGHFLQGASFPDQKRNHRATTCLFSSVKTICCHWLSLWLPLVGCGQMAAGWLGGFS